MDTLKEKHSRILGAICAALGVKPFAVKEPQVLFSYPTRLHGMTSSKNRAEVIREAGWSTSTGSQVLSGCRHLSQAHLHAYARGVRAVYGDELVKEAMAGLLLRRWGWTQELPGREEHHLQMLAQMLAQSDETPTPTDPQNPYNLSQDDLQQIADMQGGA